MIDLTYEQYTSLFNGTVSSEKFDLCYPIAWSVVNELLDDKLRTGDEGAIDVADLYEIRRTLSYLTFLCDTNTDEAGQSIYSLVASETVGPHSVTYASNSAYGSDLKGMLRYYAKPYLSRVSFYNKTCAWV
jgi:hypothetical protein